MDRNELLKTISAICTPGKGILAADESIGTIGKRFDAISLENSRENRIKYRDLLFRSPNLHEHISGVITYEETLLDMYNGDRLIQPLLENNIMVGIKVDMGVKPLYGTCGETVTQGLDGLDERCKKYYDAGARFAKWRAVLKIDMEKQLPSDLSMHENAVTLARYASICQNNGLVPIVEPEILMDGGHTIEEAYQITYRTLNLVYRELVRHHVQIDCTLLKPNMVRQGVSCTVPVDFKAIGSWTVKALRDSVPASMPGVVFLSGGMSEVEATIALNEINSSDEKTPWYLTFSYGRALQASVLSVWKGKDEHIEEAQTMLLKRAKENGLASQGQYKNQEETGSSLHENNYTY
jgi:fructose-bisphosphate aldolase class I